MHPSRPRPLTLAAVAAFALAAPALPAAVATESQVTVDRSAATTWVADTPPSGIVVHAPIKAWQLLSGQRARHLSVNSRFAPSAHASKAPPLKGTLSLAGATMRVRSDAADHRISNPVGGKDTTYFPDVHISFFTSGSQLVPLTQNVIRNGVLTGTRSYWDVIVQPGRVWNQRGDHGWHRASFPFSLVNSIEGETHLGIAMFLYRGDRVSPVRFQIVQQTAPYDVPEYFSAWGTTDATWDADLGAVHAARTTFQRSQRAQLPTKSWAALRTGQTRAAMHAFTTWPDVVQSAAVHDGVLYRTNCPTSAGPFPYCDDVRYGVWSVTKSAMLNVALLRLAQKFGPQIMNARVSRYLPGRQPQSWHDVTFLDLANMASGHGPKRPHCYLCDYVRWYLAPSEAEKTDEALDYRRYTEPGTDYNYRDQDAYLLGVAEANLLKAKQGPRADLWNMLRREVYRPIGIFYAPTNTTIESAHPMRAGHPMMAFGYYPTLDDLAKIASLFAHHGKWNGRQILDRHLVSRLLPRAKPSAAALPGSKNGSHYYLTDWHLQRMHSRQGCTRYLPQMEGWGGNTVTIASSSTTLIRIRNNWVGDATSPQKAINGLADVFTDVCPTVG